MISSTIAKCSNLKGGRKNINVERTHKICNICVKSKKTDVFCSFLKFRAFTFYRLYTLLITSESVNHTHQYLQCVKGANSNFLLLTEKLLFIFFILVSATLEFCISTSVNISACNIYIKNINFLASM